MPKKKEAWEAESFEELNGLLEQELNGAVTPIQFITNMLARRERQRLGDKRRNLARAAQLEWINEPAQAEQRAAILKAAGLK